MEAVEKINQKLWAHKSIADEYRKTTDLHAAERAIADELAAQRTFRAVLDIGIGAGRTVTPLSRLGKSYIGLDYSQTMIDLARQQHPEHDLRCMDARDLSDFADNSFDLVWFSFNGIDCVAHDDRLRILAEVRRVLADDGLFVFSSHNRDAARVPAHDLRNLRRSRNPLRMIRHIGGYVVKNINARRLKRQETHAADYAIVNDAAHRYGLLLYYISPRAQIRQLAQAGLRVERMVGLDGAPVDPDTARDHIWVHYICCPTGETAATKDART